MSGTTYSTPPDTATLKTRFPQSTLDRPVWGVWALQDRGVGQKPAKRIIDARGQYSGIQDCNLTLDAALARASAINASGIAILPGPAAGVWVADVDNHDFDHPLIQGLLSETAVELSVSGKGFHVMGLINGVCPEAFGDTAATDFVGMYSNSKKFIALTCNWVNDLNVSDAPLAASTIGAYRQTASGPTEGLAGLVNQIADEVLTDGDVVIIPDLATDWIADFQENRPHLAKLFSTRPNDRSEWLADMAQAMARDDVPVQAMASILWAHKDGYEHLQAQPDPIRALKRAIARGIAREPMGPRLVLDRQGAAAQAFADKLQYFTMPTFGANPGATSAQPAHERFRLWRGDDLTVLGSYDYTIEHILLDTGFGEIWGASGSGKSFLILDMMLHVADGRQWCGLKVKQRPVLFFAAESGDQARKRTKAWAKEKGGGQLPYDFVMVPDRPNILEGDIVADIMELIDMLGWRDRKPIVVFDTLAAVTPGMDENTSQGMGEAIDKMQRLQMAMNGIVLAIHHSGKDETRGGRGWSGLKAAVDMELHVQRPDDPDGDEFANRLPRTILRNPKVRDDVEQEPLRFEWKSVDVSDPNDPEDDRTSLVFEFQGQGQAPRTITELLGPARDRAGRNQYRRVLWNLFDEHAQVSDGTIERGPGDGAVPRGVRCIAYEELYDLFKSNSGVSDKKASETFKSAFRACITAQVIANLSNIGMVWDTYSDPVADHDLA